MASANLVVYITGQGKDLINEFRKVGNEADRSGQKTKAGWSKASAAVAVAGVAIVGAAVKIGQSSIKMADHYELAHARLETALKNSHQSWEEQAKAVNEAVQAGTKFGFTATDIEGTLAQLETSTGDTTKSLQLLSLAQDIAATKGIDLQTASLAVTKASQGQLRPLKMLGIDLPIAAGGALKLVKAQEKLKDAQNGVLVTQNSIKDGVLKGAKAGEMLTKAQEKLADAQDRVNSVQNSGKDIIAALSQKMGGQADAAAETFAGKMKALHAQIEDVQIKIGMALMPVMLKFVGVVSKVVAWLTKHQAIAKALAVVVGGALVAAVLAYTASMISAAAATIAATWPILAIVAAVAAVTAAIVLLWTHWDQVWTWISHHKALAAVIALLVPIVPAILGIVAAAKFLQEHWETIWNAITRTIQTASDIIMAVLNPIIDTIERIVDLESKIAGGIGGVTKHLPHSILGHKLPFANGGIVTGPTNALIGEAGPEAVIPLSRGRGLGTTLVINSYSLDPSTAEASIVRILREHTDKNGFIRGVRTA